MPLTAHTLPRAVERFHILNIDTTSYKDAGGVLNPQATAQIDIAFQGLELNDEGGRVVTDFGYFNGDTNEYSAFVPDNDYTVARDDVAKKFTITFLPSAAVTDAFEANRAIALLYSTKPTDPDYEETYPAEITFDNLDYSTTAKLDENAGGEPTPVGTMTVVLTKLDSETQTPLSGALLMTLMQSVSQPVSPPVLTASSPTRIQPSRSREPMNSVRLRLLKATIVTSP